MQVSFLFVNPRLSFQPKIWFAHYHEQHMYYHENKMVKEDYHFEFVSY